ncbi:cupin domain-containing protein [Rhizobium oryzicola]|uniref:Cupin domain-containing protein n=1 Tax=Rhizobium oryzicola TaxID=1232668 RepID=A0ABT8SQM7_9HYPH|nr:cupin domain-containing protein [Rhizobium oryzicola]MDO1580757.1 cupin domain-containing protein [Rhizobium oryzicola]
MVIKLAFAGALALAYRRRQSSRTPSDFPFVGAAGDALYDQLAAAPIEPDWILAGDPQARAAVQSKAQDRCSTTAMWDCTAGTFRWYFGEDETVVIVEGEVLVTAEDGTQTLLKAGDVGYFRARTWAVWHVDHYVRKIAFMRVPLDRPSALYARLRVRLVPRVKQMLRSR